MITSSGTGTRPKFNHNRAFYLSVVMFQRCTEEHIADTTREREMSDLGRASATATSVHNSNDDGSDSHDHHSDGLPECGTSD